jgi:uncharacterized coiled-coil DUF342 family protein
MDENQLNELKQKVQDVLTDGQIKLSEISVISENAKSKETELNTFHTRIIELKLQAENKAGALTETYNNAVTIKQQIDELHNQATQQKNNIDALHTDSSTKTNGINEFFGKFQELRQQVENPEEGIASTLNKAVEIFGQISKTNTDATVSKD